MRRSLQKETSRDQRVGEVRMVELQGWQRFLSSYVLTALRVSAKALPHDGPSPTIPWKKMLCCSWRDTEHSESFIRLTANRKNLRERELQVAAGTSSIPQLNSYTQIKKKHDSILGSSVIKKKSAGNVKWEGGGRIPICADTERPLLQNVREKLSEFLRW